jgi:solute carrier family 29 (equilibrative nucleoside transporter) protein 4
LFSSSGYLIAFVTLGFIALCEVAFHAFRTEIAYSVTLAAVSIVAFACTVQQSSFYGFAALLPKKKFTQALMFGESIAGFLVSSNR